MSDTLWSAYRDYERAYVAYVDRPGPGTHYRMRQAELRYRATFQRTREV